MSDTNTEQTTYYYADGKRVPLVRDPEAYAVRFRGGEKSDSIGLSMEARALLRNNSEHLGFVPNHNLQVYRLLQAAPPAAGVPADAAGAPAGRPTRDAIARDTMQLFTKLDTEPVIEFAAPVYRRGATGDLMLVTRQFVAQFKPRLTRDQIDEFNAKYDVRIIGPVDYAENGFLLEAPQADGPRGPVALGNIYYESGLTEFAHADLITKRYWRAVAPAARDYLSGEAAPAAAPAREDRNIYQSQQWHLTSANVIDAWSVTRGSASIKICILDDGVDVGHPEFANKVVAQFDFFSNVANAQPKDAQSNHGTACAGVATAAGAKALGVAPGCKLIAACTPAWGAASDEAKMFKWAADQGADVISCSWGPQDGTGAVDPLPDLTRAAINYCVTKGRGGKGCAVLFAAGNGNESVSNDGYASNPDVMAIAACTDGDVRAFYSDMGPELSVCAPSNGGSKAILTVDRRAANGYNKTLTGQDDPAKPWANDPFGDLDYTSTFGGTSSSTPLVAGVIGLMLSANPDLTPNQLRHCLENTAVKIGPSSSYDSNGHSNDFGYGKVDAGAAVRAAKNLATNPTPAALPTIQASQSTVSRTGAPPSFVVDPSPNSHYKVEFGARTELLDAEDGQPQSEYYASWEEPFMSAATYSLPQDVWNRLKHNSRLFYRAFTSSSSTDWADTIATTGDSGGAGAASIQITGAGTSSGTGGPTMSGPASISRGAGAPTFSIDPRPNTHYAIEIAARADLLDAESGQSDSEYYGTWDLPFMTESSYTLPDDVWQRLKAHSELCYRAWTSSSADGWTDTGKTAESGADAPTMQITGDGSGSTTGRVTFPSGVSFEVVDGDVQGGVDYSDPQGSGVPLLAIRGRLDERLSRSFLVKEFAGRNTSFARIDPALVEKLQELRDELGLPITVWSAYRNPAQDAQGLEGNGHVSGQTVEIKVAGRTPRDLAQFALQKLGCDIGIGLGATTIEIDVRGFSTWVLPGAPMSHEDFESFVGQTCPIERSQVRSSRYSRDTTLMASGDPRDAIVAQKPAITGPETADAAGEPPAFRIEPGRNSYYAVEVAIDPAYLDGRGAREGLPEDEFYGSWMVGLLPVEGASSVYALPLEVWRPIAAKALHHKGRLYYRLVTTSTPDPSSWANIESSLPDEDAMRAPGIDIWQRTGVRVVDPKLRPEEAFWRTSGQ
jgi:subtilisin family serine protease